MKQTKEERAAISKKWYDKNKNDSEFKTKNILRSKKYREDNKDNPEYKTKHAARHKKRYIELKENWFKFMHAGSIKCQVCGYNKCFAALDWHHNIPVEKDFRISQFMRKAFTKKNQQILLREMGKCICLCSNCHREFHDLQRKLKDETERSKEDQS